MGLILVGYSVPPRVECRGCGVLLVSCSVLLAVLVFWAVLVFLPEATELVRDQLALFSWVGVLGLVLLLPVRAWLCLDGVRGVVGVRGHVGVGKGLWGVVEGNVIVDLQVGAS